MGLLNVIIPALLLIFKSRKKSRWCFQFRVLTLMLKISIVGLPISGVNTYAKNFNRRAHVFNIRHSTHISFTLSGLPFNIKSHIAFSELVIT